SEAAGENAATPPPPSSFMKEAESKGLATANWSQPTVLLERASDKQPWQRVAVQQRIYPSHELMSLPGYRSELLTDSGIQLSLWGNMPEFWHTPEMESVAVLHAHPESDLDITLDRGRILLTNHKVHGQATVRLRFREQRWDIILLEP